MAWWAYREGHITKLALRAYFGCIELEIRRRLSGGKYQPSLAALRKLVGGPETGQGGVRPALKKLLAVGLLRSCSKTGIVFAESAEDLRVEDRSGLDAMLDQLQGLRRKVPVPRRMLRRLAGGLGKARTAVVLAHLIRCLFYRKGEGINAVGCCKASWIAEVFGITERSVYDARKFLVLELGWLIPRDCSQRVLNRDGLWVSVNLAWGPEEQGTATDLSTLAEPDEPSTPAEPDEISPPPGEFAGHFSGPSTENKKPLTGLNNQKPAGGGPPGFSNSKSDSNSQEQEPRLGDIVPADLRETGRLLELHRQAIERELLTASEADRLKFLAGAAHAQAVGSNPCRLFAWMVWKGRWEFITQADEDEAQAKLKARNRSAFEPPPDVPRPMRPTLSKDALVVQELTQVLRARGIHADPFRAVSKHLPDWTRERWDAAAAELNRAQQSSGSSTIPAFETIIGRVVAGEAELRNRY